MFDRIVTALADYTVVLEPDENTPEWWAGAPSVLLDDDGTFYMATRMREGNSPRGRRGYENRILKSADGRAFEPIHAIRRDDVGIPGFERPALVKDPATGKYRLYSCGSVDGGWCVIKFDDADHPSEFDPKTWRVVLRAERADDERPGFIQVTGYKDPVVFWDGQRWHMFAIGYDQIERIWHFTSDDGEKWATASPEPVLENADWHNVYTRPASVVPMAVGYLFVYEGSNLSWYDPCYNIATGLAYTPDLDTFIDLTPDAPLLTSTTPGKYHTWRYSHWMNVGTEMYVWWEAARPNNTNELRMATFKADWARV